MKHEIKFFRGYDCMTFDCRFDKKCSKENSHGKHGMEIGFYVHGDKGVVQFKLSTGWMPYYQKPDGIGSRHTVERSEVSHLFPMPTDLGFHSYVPQYEGQTSMGKCEMLGGKDCYYDGSSLNSYDAYYTLVNGGEEALWEFLEGYYKDIFEGAEYPDVKEYA